MNFWLNACIFKQVLVVSILLSFIHTFEAELHAHKSTPAQFESIALKNFMSYIAPHKVIKKDGNVKEDYYKMKLPWQ